MPAPTPLPIHFPLDPRGDQTVALLRSRHETKALAQAEVKAEAAVAETVRRAVKVMDRHGKLSRSDLLEFHKALDGAAKLPGLALDHRSDTNVLTAVSGASFETQMIYLSPANIRDSGRGPAGHVQIRLATFKADRKSVTFASAPFVCDWRHHAAERLHLRMEERGDAHAAIGSRMLEVHRLTNHLAAETAKRDIDLQVPVPMAGGLLMGSLDIAQPGVAVPSIQGRLRCTEAGPSFSEEQIDRVGRGLTADTAKAGTVPTWTAMTFLSEEMLSPESKEYAKGFEQLQAIARTADAQPDGLLRPEDQAAFTNAARILVEYGIANRVMPRIPQPRDMLKSSGLDRTRVDLTPMRRGIVAAQGRFADRIRGGAAVVAVPAPGEAPVRGPAWKARQTEGDDLRRDLEIERIGGTRKRGPEPGRGVFEAAMAASPAEPGLKVQEAMRRAAAKPAVVMGGRAKASPTNRNAWER